MTVKKIMGIITLVIFGGIGLFIFMLYATVKTKSTTIDKYEPYKEWVGKTVTLDKETAVFEVKKWMILNRKYPYTLIDSLHRNWQYIHGQEEMGDVVKIASFPAGTQLALEKAIQYTNGVSGHSTPMIFGTVNNGEKEYKVGYQWGTQDISKLHYNVPENWQFHQAPWQTEQDTVYYALPRADWW